MLLVYPYTSVLLYTGVGNASFILVRVLSEPLFDERNQLHTFFLYIVIHLGVEWFWIGNKFKTYMLMNRNEQGVYLVPKIEMQLIKVEKGFAGSLESPEPDGEL